MKKTRVVYCVVSLLLLLTLMGFIFSLSAEPAPKSVATSNYWVELVYRLTGLRFRMGQLRTAAHCAEFALLGLLSVNALNALYGYLRPFAAGGFAWLYAWSDEIHQLFVPGRAFQASDLVVDLVGIAAGVAVTTAFFLLLYARRRRRALHDL